jgi:hypothetical protein
MQRRSGPNTGQPSQGDSRCRYAERRIEFFTREIDLWWLRA